MNKNIISTIESNKAWGYMAISAAALALIGIVVLVNENINSKKSSAARLIAEDDLENVKKGLIIKNNEPSIPIIQHQGLVGEYLPVITKPQMMSDCSGCNSYT